MEYDPQTVEIEDDALEAPSDEYTRATRRQRAPMKLFTKVWARRAGAYRRPRKVTPVYRIEVQPSEEPISIDGPTQVFRRTGSGQVREGNLLQTRRG